MLDIRNLAVGIRTRYSSDKEGSFATTSAQPDRPPDATDGPRFLQPIDLSSGKVVISLQDMINTTVALKSNLDLEVIQPSSSWSAAIFSNTQPSLDQSTPSQHNEDQNNTPVVTAISGLQRQILLLRNDLNFELWLSRENAKHIGRLYQDQILMRTAETERQGLVCMLFWTWSRDTTKLSSFLWQYNKLRKYRTQVISLEAELREHKLQASTAKNKYADWNTELQQKMKELREEKKQWLLETGTLRTSQKETQVCEFTSVLYNWNLMRYYRRSSMHNPGCWRMRPIRYFFCKRRRKRTSTRSIGYETMSGRFKSTLRIRKCGMSQCV